MAARGLADGASRRLSLRPASRRLRVRLTAWPAACGGTFQRARGRAASFVPDRRPRAPQALSFRPL